MVRAAVLVVVLAGVAEASPQKPPPAAGQEAEVLLATGVTRERLDQLRLVLGGYGDRRPGTTAAAEALELLATTLREPVPTAVVVGAGTVRVTESRSLSIALESSDGWQPLRAPRVLPGSPAIDPGEVLVFVTARWSRTLEDAAVRVDATDASLVDELRGLQAARARCAVVCNPRSVMDGAPIREEIERRGVRPASLHLPAGLSPAVPVFEVEGADAEAIEAASRRGGARIRVHHEARVLENAPIRRLEARIPGPRLRSVIVAVGLDEGVSREDAEASTAVAAVIEAAHVLATSRTADEIVPLRAEVGIVVGPARSAPGWAEVVAFPAEATERILVVVAPASAVARRSAVVLGGSEAASVAAVRDALAVHAGKRGFFAAHRFRPLPAQAVPRPTPGPGAPIVLELGLEPAVPAATAPGAAASSPPGLRGDEALARALLVTLARLALAER